MSDYLLAAIREQPDDDLARYAFADWLEENGHADRARFIRLQLDVEAQPVRSPRAGELQAEAEQLLAEYERQWLGEWSELLVRWTFRRGFLDSVILEPDVFLDQGEALFASHPIREVRFVRPDGDPCDGSIVSDMIEAPHFIRVRALGLGGAIPSAAPQWCRALAKADHLTRLEELDLSCNMRNRSVFADFGALQELCQAEHLRSLRKVNLASPLAGEAFGDEGIALLLQSPFFSHLTSLSLSGWQMTDSGIAALLSGRGPRALQELDTSWCPQLGRASCQTVLQSRNLPNLSALSLGGDIDVAALARAPLLAQLERLELGTSLTQLFPTPADDWDDFARSPHVGRLRRLSFLVNLLDEPCVRALFETPGLLRLHSLMLMNRNDMADIAPVLASSAALQSLTALELVACSLGPDSIKPLLEAPFIAGLRQFCVAGNSIQERGLETMLRSPLSAGGLDDLHLHHCNLPASALKKLFNWRGLANVTRLELGSNTLDAEAMNALLTSRYTGKLTTLHIHSGPIQQSAYLALANSSALPRLRDLTISQGASLEAQSALRQRFGTRLRIDSPF